MTRTKYVYLVLFFLAAYSSILSQNTPQKIRVRKVPGFYFFQKGKATDTISAEQGNHFYFKGSDTTKVSVLFSIDNAQLMPLAGDTLFQLIFVPGIRYECYFERPEKQASNFLAWKCRVNGASLLPQKTIRIHLVEKHSTETILENTYLLR